MNDQDSTPWMRNRISRRSLLAATPGLALLALGVACGGDDDDDAPAATATPAAAPPTATTASAATPTVAAATAPAGEWTFVDDRGVTITRPSTPQRVVAYVPIAASLLDFGFDVVGVYGTTTRPDGTPEITAGSLDLDQVASLGEEYGTMDLEALVALQPELILFDMYGPEVDVWGLPADAVAQLEAIAPILGISFVDRPVTETIAKIEELAGALGADLTAPLVTDAQADFTAAATAVSDACAANPGLSTLFTAAWTDALYIANPPAWSDLIYFQELGVQAVTPDLPVTELWETLSWEQADKYPADLILNDARSAALTPEDLVDYPTWNAQPAVQAGQVGKWFTEFVPSYLGFTTVLEDLATSISSSKSDIVE